MRPMLGVWFFPNLGEGVPLYGGRHWWCQTGVSELLQAIYTKSCCGFASILNLNFGFPNFGGRGATMVMGMVSDRASVSCYRPFIQSRKISVANLWFCYSFEVKFWFPRFWGNGGPMGVGLRGVRLGDSDFLQIALQSH